MAAAAGYGMYSAKLVNKNIMKESRNCIGDQYKDPHRATKGSAMIVVVAFLGLAL